MLVPSERGRTTSRFWLDEREKAELIGDGAEGHQVVGPGVASFQIEAAIVLNLKPGFAGVGINCLVEG